jgi:hypothetical protein
MSHQQETHNGNNRDSASQPYDRDVDHDVDVFFDKESQDPDAEHAAQHQRDRVRQPLFRTPQPGNHLSAEVLTRDLDTL